MSYKKVDKSIKYKEKLNKKFNDNILLISPYVHRLEEANFKCKIHGVFENTPARVFGSKNGCLKCAKEDWLNQAPIGKKFYEVINNSPHLTHLDFSNSKYTRRSEKIGFVCKHHGYQEALPGTLMGAKYGCPECILEIKKDNYSFLLNAKYFDKPTVLYYAKINNLYKIGITTKVENPIKRFESDIKQGLEVKIIQIDYYILGKYAYEKEQEILQEYLEYSYIGEDIIDSGNTELFTKDILRLDM